MRDVSSTSCIVELHYLPCIRYMRLMFQYSKVLIESQENYQKASYRNRAYILSPQGKQILSIPLLKGKHQQAPVTQVQIAYHTPWYAQHWHAIQTAYGSAPFFAHYADDIRALLYQKWDLLFDLNMAFFQWLAGKIDPPGEIVQTKEYSISPDVDDLRSVIKPHVNFSSPKYPQVFEDRLGFIENLSVLDLLMHLGPESHTFLIAMKD